MRHLRKYKGFIFENMDRAKSIFKRKAEDFEKLKEMLSKNHGYIGKFAEYLLDENVPLSELDKAYKELLSLKSKSYNLDISELKFEKLLDRIQEIKNEIVYKSFLGMLPKDQKSFFSNFNSEEYGDRERKSIFNLVLSIMEKENIQTFISKVSRYKTWNSMESAMKIFAKSKSNERSYIMDLCEKTKSPIVYDKNDILIIKINDYASIQEIGSDTSWCIVSSEYQWNAYTKNRFQFVLINYNKDEHDPLFKIGFTLNKDGSIHACHDILDTSCQKDLRDIISENEIKVSDLLPEIKPIGISKINSKTPNDTLTSIYQNSKKEDIPRFISLLLSWKNKGDDFKTRSIRNLLNRYFQDEEFVHLSDLEKISDKLISFTQTKSIDIDYKLICSWNIFPRFLNDNNVWNHAAKILPIFLETWKNNLDVLYRFVWDHWSQLSEFIASKTMDAKTENTLFSILLLTFNKFEKGKNAKNTNLLNTPIVLLGFILNKKDQIPISCLDHIKGQNSILDDYYDILQIPITNIKYYIPNNIEIIEKKDYPETISLYSTNDLKRSNDLINHLKEYELHFECDVKRYLKGIRHYSKVENTIIHKIIVDNEKTRKPIVIPLGSEYPKMDIRLK